MAIKKIRISNFKSFGDLEIKLGKFNVLIGANASGKSNFMEVFRFIRDLANQGLDNAISMQGGVEYLRNINISSSRDCLVEIACDNEFRRVISKKKKGTLIGIKTYEIIYKLVLEFMERKLSLKSVKDNLIIKYEVFRLEKIKRGKNGGLKEKENLGKGQIIVSQISGDIKIRVSLSPDVKKLIEPEDIVPEYLSEMGYPTSIDEMMPPIGKFITLLETPITLIPVPWGFLFRNIAVYDFDPKLPKQTVPFTGKKELEENGANLAIVLKNIRESSNQKRKFSNLIEDLLPFVDNWDVDKFADRFLLFRLRETYSKNYLPASLLSDGTINTTALIIALYFENKPIITIEEPDKNVHPFLISKIVNMMQDASRNKQIIITTHNPEIVKYADPKNILLVFRDKEGFSNIVRPIEKKEIKIFLRKEMGLEELFIDNLLGL